MCVLRIYLGFYTIILKTPSLFMILVGVLFSIMKGMRRKLLLKNISKNVSILAKL